MAEHIYRSEQKHYIDMADYMELRSKLRHIAKPDPNALQDSRYRIRSLYFDNYEDKAVTDKLSGSSRREKFRLRYYNGDTSFIRLEKKTKVNRGCHKETAIITAGQCEKILNGRYDSLLSQESPLLSELYAKIRFQCLRPKMIVDYTREAYIYTAGNVRITIDSDIRSSNSTGAFLDPGMVGALSIVRFRTVVKEPLDLVYIFWSIIIGIIVGVGLIPLAVIGSLSIGLILFVFVNRKGSSKPYVVVLNCDDDSAETSSLSLIGAKTKKHLIKSKAVSKNGIELTVEVRLAQASTNFVNELLQVPGVSNAVLVSYNGDYYM